MMRIRKSVVDERDLMFVVVVVERLQSRVERGPETAEAAALKRANLLTDQR
jgi:hypothetical protein